MNKELLEKCILGAKLSQLSYKNKEEAQKGLLSLGHEFLDFIDIDSNQMLVSKCQGNIYFSVRGTEFEDPKDVFTDAKFKKVSFYGAEVHMGFHLAHTTLFPKVLEWINSDDYDEAVFIGHSMGAAVNYINAVAAKNSPHRCKKFSIYTYGCPRVGDESFSKMITDLFEGSTFRIVNDEDGVPTLPFRKMGYLHPEDRYSIDDNCNFYKTDILTGFLERCHDVLEDVLIPILQDGKKLSDAAKEKGIEMGKDHFIDNYLAQLVKAHDKMVRELEI